MFRGWQEALNGEIQLCPIQLPGRQNRVAEPPFTNVTALVEALLPALEPFLDIPFALFGHSMGALVSFELARECRRSLRIAPACLFVASRRAPHMPDPFQHIAQLPDAAFLAAVHRFQAAPSQLLGNPELAQLMIPAIRADISLCETYRYRSEPPLDCPISAMAGSQHDEVSAFELNAWSDQTRAGFKVRKFAGGHFFLEECASLLVEAIKEDMDCFVPG